MSAVDGPRQAPRQSRVHRPPSKFLRVAHLHRLRECEQVAAVCYRMRAESIEFLLVQTRGGRWTFPKGGTEPGLSHAQAAAIEAFEEAGVHGRIEEVAFTTYIRRKGHQSEAAELMVNAHLCEVQRIGPPQEPGRQPTWFSAGKAKRRLREDRGVDGDELARVVDRASRRIRRLRNGTITEAETVQPENNRPQPPQQASLQPTNKDALQKVAFEAAEVPGLQGRVEQASYVRYVSRQRGEIRQTDAVEFAVNTYLGKVMRLGPPRSLNGGRTVPGGMRRLSSAPVAEAQLAPVVEIDSGESASRKAERAGRKRQQKSGRPKHS